MNLTPTRRSPAPGNGNLLEGMSGNVPTPFWSWTQGLQEDLCRPLGRLELDLLLGLWTLVSLSLQATQLTF